MTTLYLIRHSLVLKNFINSNDNDQTANEKICLSIEGEEKAKNISELDELQNIDIIWSSSYVRTVQTAKYIAYKNNLEININSSFNERKLGNIKELKKIGKKYTHTYTEEQLLDNKLKNIDGESMEEVNERMTLAINKILNDYQDKRIVIVSHGAAIKYYLMNYCKLNDEIKLVYNGIILDTLSPSIIKLTFDNNKLIDIKMIKCFV